MKECTNCLNVYGATKTVCPACGYVECENENTLMEFETDYQRDFYLKTSPKRNSRIKNNSNITIITIAFFVIAFASGLFVEDLKLRATILVTLIPTTFLVILILSIKNTLTKRELKEIEDNLRSSETTGEIINYLWVKRYSKRGAATYIYGVYPIAEFTVDDKTYRVVSTQRLEGTERGRNRRLNVNFEGDNKFVKVTYDPLNPTNAKIYYNRKQKMLFVSNHRFFISVLIYFIILTILLSFV